MLITATASSNYLDICFVRYDLLLGIWKYSPLDFGAKNDFAVAFFNLFFFVSSLFTLIGTSG